MQKDRKVLFLIFQRRFFLRQLALKLILEALDDEEGYRVHSKVQKTMNKKMFNKNYEIIINN